jgi:hypothetical protein
MLVRYTHFILAATRNNRFHLRKNQLLKINPVLFGPLLNFIDLFYCFHNQNCFLTKAAYKYQPDTF